MAIATSASDVIAIDSGGASQLAAIVSQSETSTTATVNGRNARSSLARVVEPVNNRTGKADGPAAAIRPMPRQTKAIAVVRAIGMDEPP